MNAAAVTVTRVLPTVLPSSRCTLLALESRSFSFLSSIKTCDHCASALTPKLALPYFSVSAVIKVPRNTFFLVIIFVCFFLPPHLCFNPECFPRLDTWLSSILMSHYRFGLFVESLIHSEKRGFPGVVGTCVLCRRRYEVPVSVCKPYGPGCEMVKMSVSIFSDVI